MTDVLQGGGRKGKRKLNPACSLNIGEKKGGRENVEKGGGRRLSAMASLADRSGSRTCQKKDTRTSGTPKRKKNGGKGGTHQARGPQSRPKKGMTLRRKRRKGPARKKGAAPADGRGCRERPENQKRKKKKGGKRGDREVLEQKGRRGEEGQDATKANKSPSSLNL